MPVPTMHRDAKACFSRLASHRLPCPLHDAGCESGLARDAGGDGPDAIAGKPAPTSCLRSHDYIDGCRDLGGSWLASDRALSGAACIAGKPAPTSCLRSHACTDGCRGLGGSWLASDRAPSGAACIAGKPPTSCLRSHGYIDGCRGLGGSWLASDRALSGAACVAGKPTQAACAAMPAPTAAEVWVGAGLPAIGPCQAPPASRASPGVVMGRRPWKSMANSPTPCLAQGAALDNYLVPACQGPSLESPAAVGQGQSNANEVIP
jgi:hypothetical protein